MSDFFSIGPEARLSYKEYAIYGLQQVLVESSALAFPIITGKAIGLSQETMYYMVQAQMIGAGITTITQSTRFVKLPCVQGPAAVFIPILAVVALQFWMSAAFTAMAIGGPISALSLALNLT